MPRLRRKGRKKARFDAGSSLFGGEAGIKIGYSFGKIDGSIGYNFQYGFSHIYEEKARTSKTARRNSSVITAGIAYKL